MFSVVSRSDIRSNAYMVTVYEPQFCEESISLCLFIAFKITPHETHLTKRFVFFLSYHSGTTCLRSLTKQNKANF